MGGDHFRSSFELMPWYLDNLKAASGCWNHLVANCIHKSTCGSFYSNPNLRHHWVAIFSCFDVTFHPKFPVEKSDQLIQFSARINFSASVFSANWACAHVWTSVRITTTLLSALLALAVPEISMFLVVAALGPYCQTLLATPGCSVSKSFSTCVAWESRSDRKAHVSVFSSRADLATLHLLASMLRQRWFRTLHLLFW